VEAVRLPASLNSFSFLDWIIISTTFDIFARPLPVINWVLNTKESSENSFSLILKTFWRQRPLSTSGALWTPPDTAQLSSALEY
jgi:hypothetical protein